MITETNNTLEITEETSALQVQVQESSLDVSQTVQELTIQQVGNELVVDETSQELVISEEGASELEITPNALVIQRFFDGEGAVADQDTILGDGTQFDPLNAPDMLRISLKLGEFSTASDKIEARDNLGLNVIDGGQFV